MRPRLRCGFAAVDGDDLTGDKPGVVRCEELDHVRDLVNTTKATGGDGRGHRRIALFVAGGEAAEAFSRNRAGSYGVDADTLGGHLERRRTGEPVHCVLACGVQGSACATPLAKGGREVDDAAEALLCHDPELVFEAKECPSHVGVEDRVV